METRDDSAASSLNHEVIAYHQQRIDVIRLIREQIERLAMVAKVLGETTAYSFDRKRIYADGIIDMLQVGSDPTDPPTRRLFELMNEDQTPTIEKPSGVVHIALEDDLIHITVKG